MPPTISHRLTVLALGMCFAGAAKVHPPLAAAVHHSPIPVTPLSVSVSCSGHICEARARGGTGLYEGFEWSLAQEFWDSGATSAADATPYCVDDLVLMPGVTVTDTSGATAYSDGVVFCKGGPA